MPPKRVVDTNLTVRVWFKLNRDGSLADVPTVVKPGTDPLSQAANESALRAVRQCTPLQLPADKYAYWQDIEAVFDPRAIRNSDSARSSRHPPADQPFLLRPLPPPPAACSNAAVEHERLELKIVMDDGPNTEVLARLELAGAAYMGGRRPTLSRA
jgi:hypothetical protein